MKRLIQRKNVRKIVTFVIIGGSQVVMNMTANLPLF